MTERIHQKIWLLWQCDSRVVWWQGGKASCFYQGADFHHELDSVPYIHSVLFRHFFVTLLHDLNSSNAIFPFGDYVLQTEGQELLPGKENRNSKNIRFREVFNCNFFRVGRVDW